MMEIDRTSWFDDSPLALVLLDRFAEERPQVTADGSGPAGASIPTCLFTVVGLDDGDRTGLPDDWVDPEPLVAGGVPLELLTWNTDWWSVMIDQYRAGSEPGVVWVYGDYMRDDLNWVGRYCASRRAEILEGPRGPTFPTQRTLLIRITDKLSPDWRVLLPENQWDGHCFGVRIAYFDPVEDEEKSVLNVLTTGSPAEMRMVEGRVLISNEVVPAGARLWAGSADLEDSRFARVGSRDEPPEELLRRTASAMGIPFLTTQADAEELSEWMAARYYRSI